VSPKHRLHFKATIKTLARHLLNGSGLEHPDHYVPAGGQSQPQTFTGYTRAPSAVVADAVNISWSNALERTCEQASRPIGPRINTRESSRACPHDPRVLHRRHRKNSGRFHEDWGQTLMIPSTGRGRASAPLSLDSEEGTGLWGEMTPLLAAEKPAWYYDTPSQTQQTRPGFPPVGPPPTRNGRPAGFSPREPLKNSVSSPPSVLRPPLLSMGKAARPPQPKGRGFPRFGRLPNSNV